MYKYMNNESECFTGISKHEKTMYEKTRAQSASVFIHCFRVFGYPGETRARVVYMASQMNRDVKPAAHESNLLS
jgi:hypothetical protein